MKLNYLLLILILLIFMNSVFADIGFGDACNLENNYNCCYWDNYLDVNPDSICKIPENRGAEVYAPEVIRLRGNYSEIETYILELEDGDYNIFVDGSPNLEVHFLDSLGDIEFNYYIEELNLLLENSGIRITLDKNIGSLRFLNNSSIDIIFTDSFVIKEISSKSGSSGIINILNDECLYSDSLAGDVEFTGKCLSVENTGARGPQIDVDELYLKDSFVYLDMSSEVPLKINSNDLYITGDFELRDGEINADNIYLSEDANLTVYADAIINADNIYVDNATLELDCSNNTCIIDKIDSKISSEVILKNANIENVISDGSTLELHNSHIEKLNFNKNIFTYIDIYGANVIDLIYDGSYIIEYKEALSSLVINDGGARVIEVTSNDTDLGLTIKSFNIFVNLLISGINIANLEISDKKTSYGSGHNLIELENVGVATLNYDADYSIIESDSDESDLIKLINTSLRVRDSVFEGNKEGLIFNLDDDSRLDVRDSYFSISNNLVNRESDFLFYNNYFENEFSITEGSQNLILDVEVKSVGSDSNCTVQDSDHPQSIANVGAEFICSAYLLNDNDYTGFVGNYYLFAQGTLTDEDYDNIADEPYTLYLRVKDPMPLTTNGPEVIVPDKPEDPDDPIEPDTQSFSITSNESYNIDSESNFKITIRAENLSINNLEYYILNEVGDQVHLQTLESNITITELYEEEIKENLKSIGVDKKGLYTVYATYDVGGDTETTKANFIVKDIKTISAPDLNIFVGLLLVVGIIATFLYREL